MKTKLYPTLLFVCLAVISAAQNQKSASPTANISKEWETRTIANLQQKQYGAIAKGNLSFRMNNAAQQLVATVTGDGYTVSNGSGEDWNVKFDILEIAGNIKTAFRKSTVIDHQNEIIFSHPLADIEYVNNEKGIRQNFIVKQKPSDQQPLTIRMKLTTTLSPRLVNNTQLQFSNNSGTKLSYEDLKVWDATHRLLDARMELHNNILSIVVDDKNAQYPVTVDPLNKAAEWTTSANGIIPGLLNNLQLQVQTLYGFTVTGLGDVNNDGYDDAAISAPGMANVITGTGNLLNVGAVFIYLGSDTGFADAPDKVLQPTTAVAGALFGFSVDAGDVSGDGIPDIVISAPLDRYSTTASGLFGNVSVNVTAGRVYVYNSENLFAAPNPSPLLTIRLRGTNFWCDGAVGLFSNITVNALFGFSVAVTDDLNGDNRKDIIIGAPAYQGVQLLSVKSGAAFVYYSNDLGTTTPVELTRPTPSILGLITLPIANLNGLLFGYSVDGVGDFNSDGHPDVVVGAPAGIDLSSLPGIFSGQVLGGSAYVYYGDGSSMQPAIGATLHASTSGLLSNAANLFGYKVKGIRDNADVHTGGIMISAPVGGVISNVVNGLRLKAGQVHIFQKKSGLITSPMCSDQALTSPRSSSLLTLLGGNNLQVSLLYGAGLDNARDVNCDGRADIIIGEPLSTTVPLIGAEVTGGAAYVYLAKPDGSYNSLPSWSMYPQVSPLLGVNATSLVGFSVAGLGHTHGASQKVRIMTGGPANTLDFGAGLLNLGNTVSTISSFLFDNNGIGKSYMFEPDLCSMFTLPAKLTAFGGYAENKTSVLNWKSEAEENLNYYEVQRSRDGIHFETISVVFAKGRMTNDYQITDASPFEGVNYYRLNMVDQDGSSKYSNIINIRFDSSITTLMNAYPNPAKSDITVQLDNLKEGKYTLKLITVTGQQLFEKPVQVMGARQSITITELEKYSNGIYSLGLYDQSGKCVQQMKIALNKG